ncbi:EF-hand calcium-binding domain-containing protein 14 [Microtus ochrogaster]|uniref:EF-hand calcium-binding domain-containing protein 14 n=1 Tax=Microtus ochrogaster TaxID=79684 RepID=A0A8J6G1M3_MICOH|nr:EF-hand calcium-binding domain-containing protein 14 [Microtus ochrogaster]
MAHGSASRFLILSSSQSTVVPLLPRADRDLDIVSVELVKEAHTLQILFSLFINPFQISLLSSAVNHLKTDVKSAADLLSLPSTVEGLQKSVASIGNTLNSVHLAVEAIQKTVDEHKKTLESLQSSMDILYLQNSLEEINSTVVGYQRQSDLKFEGMNETLSSLTQRLSLVESDVVALSKAEKRANLTSSMKEDNSNSQVSKLREKLQLISALTNKPGSNRPPETAEEGVSGHHERKTTQPRFTTASQGNTGEAAVLQASLVLIIPV